MQTRNLLAHLDVRANVRLARLVPGGARRRDVDALLDQVGLAHRAAAYPTELSGGELARAGLAVALANEPDIVLADEPTGELDGQSESQALDLLRERAGQGAALLVVTHSARVVAIADRVVTLHDGTVIA